jgi:hypothetical protein
LRKLHVTAPNQDSLARISDAPCRRWIGGQLGATLYFARRKAAQARATAINPKIIPPPGSSGKFRKPNHIIRRSERAGSVPDPKVLAKSTISPLQMPVWN